MNADENKTLSKPKTLSKQKLTELMFLLMRDCCPTSELLRIVKIVGETPDYDEVIYENEHLRAYAERLAGEILE